MYIVKISCVISSNFKVQDIWVLRCISFEKAPRYIKVRLLPTIAILGILLALFQKFSDYAITILREMYLKYIFLYFQFLFLKFI